MHNKFFILKSHDKTIEMFPILADLKIDIFQ